MQNRAIPIDGELCGVVAIPVPEQGDLRFVDLIDRFIIALGRSGADRILWRPIGNPRSTDEDYESIRSREQQIDDEYSARKYDDLVASRGGDRHHRIREYDNLPKVLKIAMDERPCIVFTTNPPVGRRCVLKVPRRMLASRDSENALGDWLVENISAKIVESVLRDGYLNVDSMARLVKRIAELESELYKLQPEIKAERVMPHGAYAKLVVNGDESYLNRNEYEDLVEVRRRDFQLLVDVPGGRVYCRKGRRQRMTTLRPRAIRILAEVMVTDRPILIYETNTGKMCASDKAAINAFCVARAAVQQSGGYSAPLFTTRRSLTGARGTYEFTPSQSLIWGIVAPVD